GIGQLPEVRLERRDVGGLFGQALHAPALAEAECLLERSDRGHDGQGTAPYNGDASTSQRSPSTRRARTTYSVPCASPTRSSSAARPSVVCPSTLIVLPSRVAASSTSSPTSPGTWTSSILVAATAQVSPPRRTASALYGAVSTRSTASANGASAPSGSSSSTTSVPSASEIRWRRSPFRPGASTVATASQRRARGTPW